MSMTADTVGLMAVGAAVLVFLWSLHRDIGALRQDMNQDMGDIRDRVSRVESMLAGAGLKAETDPASG